MKRRLIPNYIQELYNPTAKEWWRWMRFRRKAIAAAQEGHDAFEAYYKKCAKAKCRKSTFTRCGMYAGSSSSTDELEMFEWAWFSRRVCFQGVSISLSIEGRDSDIRDLAYTNNF